jgi:hypothetical protein
MASVVVPPTTTVAEPWHRVGLVSEVNDMPVVIRKTHSKPDTLPARCRPSADPGHSFVLGWDPGYRVLERPGSERKRGPRPTGTGRSAADAGGRTTTSSRNPAYASTWWHPRFRLPLSQITASISALRSPGIPVGRIIPTDIGPRPGPSRDGRAVLAAAHGPATAAP